MCLHYSRICALREIIFFLFTLKCVYNLYPTISIMGCSRSHRLVSRNTRELVGVNILNLDSMYTHLDVDPKLFHDVSHSVGECLRNE